MRQRCAWVGLFLSFAAWLAAAPPVRAVAQWQRYELELKTEVRYDLYQGTAGNPYRDLQLAVYWSTTRQSTDPSKPSGFGFWDGTRVEGTKTYNIFKIRTALAKGTYYLWHKCTGRTPVTTGPDCSTDSALNLNAQSALTVTIDSNNRTDNKLYTNGFLQIPSGERYLSYTGRPDERFYWLGDTAWPAPSREGQAMMAARRSNPNLPAGTVSSNWQTYINDRVKSTKAYTVIQVAPAVAWEPKKQEAKKSGCGTVESEVETSVQWSSAVKAAYPGPETFAFDQISTSGCVGAVPNNCSRWKPEYWREVDSMVEYANSKGLVVLMAGVADPSDRGHCRVSQDYPTKESSVIFARNLAARLAGNHVVYSINFDDWPDAVLDYDGAWPGTVHDTTLLVGAELKRAAPRHLVSNHLAGSAPVSVYTRYQSQSWLNFHLIHSGHALNVGTSCPGSSTSWQSKQKCAISRALDFTQALRSANPAKPVVNGEGPYEYPQRAESASYPPDNRYGMRHGAYASLVSGAAGFTGGVNGDLDKNEAGIVAWDRPLEVLNSPGASTDLPAIRKLLNALAPSNTSWGEFTKATQILVDTSTPPSNAGDRRIFAGVRNNDYVVYVPNSAQVRTGSGLRGFSCSTWTAAWRNPRNFTQSVNVCPKNQAVTEFPRPASCGDLPEADRLGLCDWVMTVRRPNGVSASSLAGNYVASRWAPAELDGQVLLEGGGDRLFSQLMGTDDLPLGSEIEVSPSDNASYGLPGVAREPFAGVSWMVWEADGSNDGEETDIFARRVGSDGSPLGEAFRVNQVAALKQYDPFFVADAIGNVTVVWAGDTNTNELGKPKADIFARRYRADGTALGNEFLVNTTTEKSQDSPVAGADASGNVVIGWLTKRQEISVRLYTSAGTPSTGEISIRVAPFGIKDLELVEIVVDPLGSFVVRWNEYSRADEFLGWYSRAYDSMGRPLGDIVSEGL